MLFPRLVSFLALLLPLATQARKTIEELFDVSYDHTVAGHCGDYGSARLNAMLGDAEFLASSGIAMVAAAKDPSNLRNGPAIRNLAAWFKAPILTAAHYDKIGGTYKAVNDFIQGTLTAVDGGRSTLKPLLVCGDNGFVLRQTMEDQAWGLKDGKQTLLTHNDNTPFKIKDNPEYVLHQKISSQVAKKPTYPYWSPRLGLYIFDKMHGTDGNPINYLCAGDDDPKSIKPYGVTKNWPIGNKPHMIYLCASGFEKPGEGVKAHSVKLNCMDDSLLVNSRPPAELRKDITTAINIIPDGGTLFHEMIHLVVGSRATIPPGPRAGEEYSPAIMLGINPRPSSKDPWTSDMAMVNPQTYTYAAAGFDYTIYAPLVNNRFPEFYTGYCTWKQ